MRATYVIYHTGFKSFAGKDAIWTSIDEAVTVKLDNDQLNTVQPLLSEKKVLIRLDKALDMLYSQLAKENR